MDFWDMMWFIFVTFAFVAYLMVLFTILTDLLRDPDVAGWAKAAWVVALLLLPLLTSVVYLIVRGRSMAQHASAGEVVTSQRAAYDRGVAGTPTAADEIARARQMYEAGMITEDEYARLREKALV
jgi:hypothetical protein